MDARILNSLFFLDWGKVIKVNNNVKKNRNVSVFVKVYMIVQDFEILQ